MKQQHEAEGKDHVFKDAEDGRARLPQTFPALIYNPRLLWRGRIPALLLVMLASHKYFPYARLLQSFLLMICCPLVQWNDL
jgi:hypothetical protein